VGDKTLQERLAGNVLDGIADADEREQEEGRDPVRRGGDERNRNAPKEETHAERDREPAAGERHRREADEQGSGTDGAGEEAHPASSPMQQPEGDHDDQDVQGAADDRLRNEERDDQPWMRLARQQSKAGRQISLGAMLRE